MMQGPLQGPFPPQPGMQMQQGHIMGAPGPGHPMQQGMMHQGVSGPAGPVSQAGPMMGMQSGNPNAHAHALSHLQPQQAAHMFQQQQQGQQQQQHPGMMNPALNPQLMAQAQAQRTAMLRQQQQQAMMQQANQQNAMGMGFPQQMANMTPQAMAALQAGNMGQPFVNLPPHLRHLQQQQQAMSAQAQQQATSNPQQAAAIAQAHAAQMNQQAQAQAAAQAQQHAQQQQQMQQQQAQAQAIAMQHAQSQQSNHSQSGSQAGPTTTQGPQQGPLRPQSAMSHQGQASPAPQPTPQQQPQPAPQPRQQTPAPSQTPNIPQQPNQQQPTPAQMQQRAQGQAMQQAQVNPAAAQAQQNVNAANAARLAMLRQNQSQGQNPNASGGPGILKLMNFVNELSKYSTSRDQLNTMSLWQAFVEKFFSESGSLLHVAYHRGQDRTKLFEVVYAALPRYFLSLFSTDVENLQITIDGATEKINGSDTKVECDRAKFIYTYKNQCQVICHGKLIAFWTGGAKMEWLQLEMQGHQQMIPRDLLEGLFAAEEINPLNAQQSPRMNKKNQKNVQQRQPPEATMPISKLPSVGLTDWGLPPALFHFLEIYETMNNMTSLITHSLENPSFTPADAMDNWNTVMASNNPLAQQNASRMQGAMPPNQGMPQAQQPMMAPGSRTPSGMGQPGLPPNQYMSPAMQNGLLPNGHMSSPSLMQNHTPSPASHAMAHQQSQSSNTASVNTSPNNMNNKRRRSTAKMDGDDGDANGATKVKPSPRMGGGNKRVKGN